MAEPRRRPAAGTTSRSPARSAGSSRSGLWHNPAMLNLVADICLLFGSTALAYAAFSWFLRQPLFPLDEVVLLTPPAQVTESQLEYAARSAVDGGFFTVDLDRVRETFEKLPWVRRAEVRRRWPASLELRLEEHVAVAYWSPNGSGETRLVNRQGEVFVAASNADMPQFDGPQGSASWLLARHAEFSDMLQPLGVRLVGLALSAREAWRLQLDNGMTIVLGREQDKSPLMDRLRRFIAVWPRVHEQIDIDIKTADLRYASGFALTPADASVLQQPVAPAARKGRK